MIGEPGAYQMYAASKSVLYSVILMNVITTTIFMIKSISTPAIREYKERQM